MQPEKFRRASGGNNFRVNAHPICVRRSEFQTVGIGGQDRDAERLGAAGNAYACAGNTGGRTEKVKVIFSVQSKLGFGESNGYTQHGLIFFRVFVYNTWILSFVQSAGLVRKHQVVVTANQRPERLDAFVTRQIENLSRSRVHQLLEAGLILVNGQRKVKSYSIRPSDVIDISLPTPEPMTMEAEDIPLDIAYEDADLLVINKPAGMVVHPAYSNWTGTLVNALLHHVNDLSGINGKLRPGIIHRIDKDTSGLLLVTKHDRAHRFLANLFRTHRIEREYWALAWGKFKNKKGTIDAPIGRSPKDRKKFAVVNTGKHAVTHYDVMETFDVLSLVKLRLETGRTHQIRVHLAHVGHPIFGDRTYGGDNDHLAGGEKRKRERARNLLEKMPRQALHAKTLGFQHPSTKKIIRLDSELPSDFREVLHLLKGT